MRAIRLFHGNDVFDAASLEGTRESTHSSIGIDEKALACVARQKLSDQIIHGCRLTWIALTKRVGVDIGTSL